MDIAELISISQGTLAIMNPTTPEKVIAAGRAAGLRERNRVVETGCGNGTILALWGHEYGISGVGIEAGFDVAAVIRSDENDWDRYESGIWQALLSWLGDNPGHPDRDFIIDYLHRLQDEYFGYGREYMDWAMYVLVPGFW